MSYTFDYVALIRMPNGVLQKVSGTLVARNEAEVRVAVKNNYALGTVEDIAIMRR